MALMLFAKSIHLSLLLTIAFLCNNLQVKAQVIASDSLALIALYNGTDGSNWSNKWDLSAPVNTWYGVTVTWDGADENKSGKVSQLNLNSNNLVGQIPDGIGNLLNLTALDLGSNYELTGLPEAIGSLSKLTTLILSFDKITDNIPVSIGNLINLKTLDLSQNQLVGSIPESVGSLTKLTELRLSDNKVTGNIPESIGNLSNLKYLYLQGNLLSGTIPNSIGSLSNLEILNLTSNQLTGVIPESIGNLSKLIQLELSVNLLTGNIPETVGGLLSLSHLELGTNHLSGSIPESIGNLSGLNYLSLSTNRLTGTIPDLFSKLLNLTILNLSSNQLSGSIVESIGSLSKLGFLDLSSNQLTGNIPALLGVLSKLSHLNLSDNQLAGDIPVSLGNLTNLTGLYLFWNLLSGNIPQSFGGLFRLQGLNLTRNQLSGDIPNAFKSFSQLYYFGIAENRFNYQYLEPFMIGLPVSKFSFVYAPQDSIPIKTDNGVLGVSVGGTFSNNSFHWYSTDAAIDTLIYGDSSFVPTKTGHYFLEVKNKLLPNLTLYGHILLTSLNLTICPNSNTTLRSTISGSSYQWQEDNGSGFVDLFNEGKYSNVQSQNLQLTAVPSSWYGRLYRCRVNGVNGVPFTLKIQNHWISNFDSNWEDVRNWSCGALPDVNTDVFIDNGIINVIGNAVCRSLSVTSSNAKINIAAGGSLTITH